jgi:hypothetical protein
LRTYYLIVQQMGDGPSATVDTSRTRKVEGTRQIADIEAKSLERSLNGGLTIYKAIDARHDTLFLVTAELYNTARNYSDFHRWPCNSE